MQIIISFGRNAIYKLMIREVSLTRTNASVRKTLIRPDPFCYLLSVNRGSEIAPVERTATCVTEWCQTRDLAEEEMSRK